jgi:hypothetical protein
VVEHNLPDPSLGPLTPEEAAAPVHLRGGLCVICGEWVETTGEDAFRVTLTRTGGEVGEYAAHATCMARVAHPGARLPPPSETVPDQAGDEYLAGKPRTPEGR